MSYTINGVRTGGGASLPAGTGLVSVTGGVADTPVPISASGLAAARPAAAVAYLGRTYTSTDTLEVSLCIHAGGSMYLWTPVLLADVGDPEGTVAVADGAGLLRKADPDVAALLASTTVAGMRTALSLPHGLDAARPAAGTAGAQYTATDTGIVYADTGSAWRVASAGGAPENLCWSALSAVNYLDAGTGASLGPAFGVGQTLALSFQMGTLPGASPAGDGIVWWYADITNVDGFLFAVSTSWSATNQLGIYLGAAASPVGGNPIPVTLSANTPYRIAVAYRDSTHLDWGVNGTTGTITIAGNYTPPGASARHTVGRSPGTASPMPADFALGALVGMSTALSLGQLATLTTVPATAERFRLPTPAGVTENFSLRCAHAIGRGTRLLSGGASPVDFAIVAAPTLVTR